MTQIKRIRSTLAVFSIIFALTVIIPAHAVVLTGNVVTLDEQFSRNLDDSIHDLRDYSAELEAFVSSQIRPVFKLLQKDPAFMARVKAARDLHKFQFLLRDAFQDRAEKLEKLKILAAAVSSEVKRYIHRYDDLDRDGHQFTAAGRNWSLNVWFHNQPYTRTPYFAMIKKALETPIVWSETGDSLVTLEMLLMRLPELDLNDDEKALINSSAALNKNLSLQIEPVDSDEFREILRHPKIPEIIRSMQFASGPLAVLVPRSEEVTTLILLRRHSKPDSFGIAVGERVFENAYLYKIDFVGEVKIDSFMPIGFREKPVARTFLEPQKEACAAYVMIGSHVIRRADDPRNVDYF